MTYVTKDSGECQEFSSGMRRDTQKGKARYDLISPLELEINEQPLHRWAELMGRGADKYGPRNWERANSMEEYQRFKESAYRHFMQWYYGDKEEDHMAATMFNLTGAEYVLAKLKKKTE
jgi:hypothetical protein